MKHMKKKYNIIFNGCQASVDDCDYSRDYVLKQWITIAGFVLNNTENSKALLKGNERKKKEKNKNNRKNRRSWIQEALKLEGQKL